ncbi:unnamed protein product [Oppiella nova]|uniref:Uncharacterized protein n=1 Tax=Oppiella nova TaxID=334625 RepID=A0A7R9QD39_9ACAR|nr:unnamed protein product [Oppiella nova]CAG2162903.1 unnamed protein product [Oppiella nova]
MQTFGETLASAEYNRKLCKSSDIPYQSCETIFSLLVRETKFYFCQMVITEEYLKGLADIPYDTRAGIPYQEYGVLGLDYRRLQTSIGLNAMSDTIAPQIQTNNSQPLVADAPSPPTLPVDTNQNSEIKDNGTEEVDQSSPQKKIKLSNDVNDEPKPVVTTPPSAGRGRPAKGSSKRLNILEKTAKEGEALLHNLGHKGDENPDGNRRTTRSQTRGTPPAAQTPPTPKKAATPKSPSKDNSSSGTPKRRGRPPKNSISSNNSVEDKSEVEAIDNSKAESAEETNEVEKTSAVNNTNDTNNTNDSSEPKPSEAIREEAVDKANEQTNDLSVNDAKKANSISEDTSKPVPVLETTQPPPQKSE